MGLPLTKQNLVAPNSAAARAYYFSRPLSYPVNAMPSEAFEGPDVLRFDVAEEVAIAVLRKDTEERFPGGSTSDPRFGRWAEGCHRV